MAKKVDGDSLFYKESHGKDKMSWAQVARVRFQSDKVENSCIIRTIVIMSPEKWWISPTLDTFKFWLDKVLGHLVYYAFAEKSWTVKS